MLTADAVGEWVREQRRSRWWTQLQLAAEVNAITGDPVSVDDVNAYERGWELVPPSVLLRMVAVFGQWPPDDVPVARGVASVR